jgi:multicomponent Na+:H+ antiporter subunit B
MKWIYIAACAAFFVKMLVPFEPAPELPFSIVDAIVQDSGVPNAVAGILFRNRLYDTILEVVVFTIAVGGAHFLLENEHPAATIRPITDPPAIIMARLGSTIAALVGIELALRGHLSPGGGFAAGVAGGTAIGLAAMTSPPERMAAAYERWRAAFWEKVSVVVFLLLAVMTLAGAELPRGDFGTLISGGILPVLNVLVAVKVALGSWAIVLTFIRHRGLL